MISQYIKKTDLRFQYKCLFHAKNFPYFAIEPTLRKNNFIIVFVNKKEDININESGYYTYDSHSNKNKLISTKIDFELPENIRNVYSTKEITDIKFNFPNTSILNQLPVLDTSRCLDDFFQAFEFHLSFTKENALDTKLKYNDKNFLFETLFSNGDLRFVKVSFQNKLTCFIQIRAHYSQKIIVHSSKYMKEILLYIEKNYKDSAYIFSDLNNTSQDLMLLISDDDMINYIDKSTARKLNDF